MGNSPASKTTEALRCLRCDTTEGVKMESSRTQYPFKGKVDDPENPNRDVPLCRVCAKEHHDHWDERWADYRAGLL